MQMDQTVPRLTALQRNTAVAMMEHLQTRVPRGQPSYSIPIQQNFSAAALVRHTAAAPTEAMPLQNRVEFLIR